jgi:hypothetical protein
MMMPQQRQCSSRCHGESRRQAGGSMVLTQLAHLSDPTGALSSPAKLTRLRPTRRIG